MKEIPSVRTSTEIDIQPGHNLSRPFGVTAIAFLQVITSGTAIYRWWLRGPFDAGFLHPSVFLNSLSVAIAITGLIVAVGLLWMVRWAWPLALFVLSIQLAVGLWAYNHNQPFYETMVPSVASIFYLNSRDVRGAFGYVRVRESLPVE